MDQERGKYCDCLVNVSNILSQFCLIAAISIKCTDGGPVFYKQERLTKDGKRFEILKFRTTK